MSPISNLVMWNTIVGFLMPLVVAVVEQPKFTKGMRAVVMAVTVIIGGFATAYFNDQFNFEDIVGSVLITGVSAISFYKGFWKPTGVATAIEGSTSPRHPSPPPSE